MVVILDDLIFKFENFKNFLIERIISPITVYLQMSHKYIIFLKGLVPPEVSLR